MSPSIRSMPVGDQRGEVVARLDLGQPVDREDRQCSGHGRTVAPRTVPRECRYDRCRGRTRELAIASMVDRPRRSGRRDACGRAADRRDSQPGVRPPRRRDLVVVPGAGRHRSARRIAGGHLRACRRTGRRRSTHPARREAWVGCCRSSPSDARPATSWRCVALGSTGALDWFAPAQPILAVLSLVLLGWALRARLRSATVCRIAA